MNQKQARLIAYEIICALIDQEWGNPSDLLCDIIDEHGFSVSKTNSRKVVESMQACGNELRRRRERLEQVKAN